MYKKTNKTQGEIIERSVGKILKNVVKRLNGYKRKIKIRFIDYFFVIWIKILWDFYQYKG